MPSTVALLCERWSLTVGEPFQPGGRTAWVAPVRDSSGAELVLKVGWRHPEAAHEADGLREWAGDGAVLLHDAVDFNDTTALLLERCWPGTTLASREQPEQDRVIAGLLRRLWREPAPGHDFRSLKEMCDAWADAFEDKVESAAVPPDAGLARAALTLFRELPAGAERNVLLCTDLHAENVLAAGREPWLVIDPKPFVGDPHYDVLQHMLNCPARLQAEPRRLAERMANLAELDADRVVLWLFTRCLLESVSPEFAHLGEVARLLAPT